MNIVYCLTAELPFVLNLEDAVYVINVDSEYYEVNLYNNLYAGVNGILGETPNIQISELEDLNKHTDLTSKIKLRTVIQWKLNKDITLVKISSEDAKGYYLNKKNVNLSNRDKLLRNFSKLSLKRKNKIYDEAKAYFSINKYCPDDILFLRIINKLIQSYMLAFNDNFVEEITLAQLGKSVSMGIIRNAFDTKGNLLQAITKIGKIPFVTRKKWYNYSEEQKKYFSETLIYHELNPIELMLCRAKIHYECGKYREAVIEANAAMEFSVQNRLYNKMLMLGNSDEEIKQYLKKNQRFKERCNEIFEEIIGFSLIKKDNVLWDNVLKNRENIRHLVAHSNKELNSKDAQNAIDCFVKFAELAQK